MMIITVQLGTMVEYHLLVNSTIST